MRTFYLTILAAASLFSTSVVAKKPIAPIQATTKATKLDRADMLEGQLLTLQAATLNDEAARAKTATAALEKRIDDYRARIKAQYNVDFAAKDSLNFETGVITWHVDPPATPPAPVPQVKPPATAPAK